jgi:hypothetical protein
LSWLYIAFCLPTNWIRYPYLLALLSLFNCIINSFLGANHCCYFSWIFVFLWKYLDLIMLCLSGATLLFGFVVSLFIAFPLFSTLWALYQYVCIVCYTFNNYLTTLFDVYCMLSQSICCMCFLPTKCSYTPPRYPFIQICLGWIHQNVHLYPPQILSLGNISVGLQMYINFLNRLNYFLCFDFHSSQLSFGTEHDGKTQCGGDNGGS